MIFGNKSVIENTIDLTYIGITFSSEPIIVGGLVANAELHTAIYENAPNGTIYGDKYM